jgi:uncharacterized protein YdeI (BOF family)
MKRLTLLFGALLAAALCALVATTAQAGDGHRIKGKKLPTLTTVEEVVKYGRDDQYAELVGRFTERFSKDQTGAIVAELDDDEDWNFAKDQLVRILAEVDRDHDKVTIEVLAILPPR